MYKKYAVVLLMMSMILGMAFINDGGRTFIIKLSMSYQPETRQVIKIYDDISGSLPVINVQSVENPNIIVLSEADKRILCKIVEAEAGCEDRIGKILVANVVLNRLESDSFPDTIKEVVYQQEEGVTQFSPVANGTFEKAVPGEETIEAVEAALMGEDYSDGALYFVARQYADSERVKWFDNNLEMVLVHGGHEFYR